jgi:hypothetical protein
MDRLNLISQLDPEWYLIIEKFLMENPEFGPYVYLVPIKRPIHNQKLKPKYFIAHLLQYIAEAGVNTKYAINQWSFIMQSLQENNYDMGIMLNKIGDQLQPKKRQIYADLWEKVKDIGALNYTFDHLLQTKIKGIGPGCIGQLKQFWSTDNNAVEISDRGFVAGFAKVYNLDKKPTSKKISEKVETWGENKIVGSLICTQIFHYLLSN